MVEVLKEIEYILISLHKVGSHYAETLLILMSNMQMKLQNLLMK